jgi:hypothetical protein
MIGTQYTSGCLAAWNGRAVTWRAWAGCWLPGNSKFLTNLLIQHPVSDEDIGQLVEISCSLDLRAGVSEDLLGPESTQAPPC